MTETTPYLTVQDALLLFLLLFHFFLFSLFCDYILVIPVHPVHSLNIPIINLPIEIQFILNFPCPPTLSIPKLRQSRVLKLPQHLIIILLSRFINSFLIPIPKSPHQLPSLHPNKQHIVQKYHHHTNPSQ